MQELSNPAAQRLYEHRERNQLDLDARIAQEVELGRIREERELRKDLRRIQIARDVNGDLWVGFFDQSGKLIMGNRLFCVRNFRSVLYFTYRKKKAALKISWDGSEGFFLLIEDTGTNGKRLRSKLSCHGITMNISGRKEHEASEMLLAFLMHEADAVEIAECHGWNIFEDGNWHFVGNNELTWKEVTNEI